MDRSSRPRTPRISRGGFSAAAGRHGGGALLALESRGNPFFLDELVHASLGEPTPAIRRSP